MEKSWKAWKYYATTWNIEPFLQVCDQLDIIIVVVYVATQVQQGYYGKGIQIKVPTVAKALLAVTTSINMVEKSYPFKTTDDEYIFPDKRLIEGLRRDNPPQSHNLHSLSACQITIALRESFQNHRTYRQLGN